MTYSIKLLAAALLALLAGLWMARPLLAAALPEGQYRRAAQLMLAFVVISFLSMKPVIFMVLLAMVLVFVALNDQRKPADIISVYTLAVLVLPPITLTLGDLGDINQLLTLRPARVAGVILLIPVAFQLLFAPATKRPGWQLWTDVSVLAYYALRVVLSAPYSSTTTLLRTTVETLIDTFIPYYVVSRGLKTESEVRQVLVWMGLGIVFAACVALIESGLQHKIYAGLQGIYGVSWQLTYNLSREGYLRSEAMAPQPIVLGFMLVFGAGAIIVATQNARRVWHWLSLLTLLAAALLATSSRGPLLGAIVFVVTLAALHGGKAGRFRLVAVTSLVGAVLLRMSGLDSKVTSWVSAALGGGLAGASTTDYRQVLLDTAMALVQQSPWFGVPNYLAYMEHLRQGEGIIDMVNSYAAIALDTGLVGLALYLAPFAIVSHQLLKHLSEAGAQASHGMSQFASVFVALTCASLVMILTVSTLGAMPYLMLLLVALPIAWLRRNLPDIDPARPWAARAHAH